MTFPKTYTQFTKHIDKKKAHKCHLRSSHVVSFIVVSYRASLLHPVAIEPFKTLNSKE